LTRISQGKQYSDQQTEKIQRPNPQDAPCVEQTQVNFPALFMFAKQKLGNQIGAQEKEKINAKSSRRSRTRNQGTERDAASREIGRISANRVKNEDSKEREKTKAI
jgi:hypothetical protein